MLKRVRMGSARLAEYGAGLIVHCRAHVAMIALRVVMVQDV